MCLVVIAALREDFRFLFPKTLSVCLVDSRFLLHKTLSVCLFVITAWRRLPLPIHKTLSVCLVVITAWRKDFRFLFHIDPLDVFGHYNS